MSYNEFVRRVLTVFALILAGVALWQLKNILMMGFLAAIIAVSLAIPVEQLQRWGLKRGYAIAITLIGVIVAIFLFFAWVLPPLAIQMADLFAEFPTAFETSRTDFSAWYTRQNNALGGIMPALDSERINALLTDVANLASPVVAVIGNGLVSGLANLLVIIVVAIFLLLEPKGYARGFLALMPEAYRARALEILVELRLTVTTWMTALTFAITITTVLVFIVLGLVLGVPNALALGAIAGISSIIPNIGIVIPMIPITIFTLADDPAKLPIVIPAYALIQLIESNVLTPSIVKRELNIPAALILLFQLIAASLLGFFGVLLAVPLLAIIITLVREIYVYDVLKMRGTAIDIEADDTGRLQVVTKASDPLRDSLVTQTQVRLTGLMSPVQQPSTEEKGEGPA